MQEIRYALGTASASSATQIPNNAVVISAELDVTTPYSGGTTISIGVSGSTALFMGTADNVPGTVGLYQVSQDTVVTPAANVLATVAGGPVAGAATVIVRYTQPQS